MGGSEGLSMVDVAGDTMERDAEFNVPSGVGVLFGVSPPGTPPGDGLPSRGAPLDPRPPRPRPLPEPRPRAPLFRPLNAEPDSLDFDHRDSAEPEAPRLLGMWGAAVAIVKWEWKYFGKGASAAVAVAKHSKILSSN